MKRDSISIEVLVVDDKLLGFNLLLRVDKDPGIYKVGDVVQVKTPT